MRHLGSSWRHLGVLLAHLGAILAHLGVILAHLGTSWGPLETPWKGFGRSWGSLGKTTFGCAKTHRIIEIDALRDRYLRGVRFANLDFFSSETPKSLNTYDTLGDTFASRSNASDFFSSQSGTDKRVPDLGTAWFGVLRVWEFTSLTRLSQDDAR